MRGGDGEKGQHESSWSRAWVGLFAISFSTMANSFIQCVYCLSKRLLLEAVVEFFFFFFFG
jgi:hypothetical protein